VKRDFATPLEVLKNASRKSTQFLRYISTPSFTVLHEAATMSLPCHSQACTFTTLISSTKCNLKNINKEWPIVACLCPVSWTH
jgi:hypothetical protein